MISKYETRFKKELRDCGWQVDWKIRSRIPCKGYSVDYFGLFDILAYKKGCKLRFISVKGKHGIYKSHLNEVRQNFKPKGIQKEIWVMRKTGKVARLIIK